MSALSARTGRVKGYSAAQIGLHWLIAALVFVQLVFGESMSEVIEAAEEGERASGFESTMATVHYYFGITILVLVALRLVLRVKNGAPLPPETGGLLALGAKLSHGLIYVLLVVVPVTGLLGYYLGDPFGEWHNFAKPAFIALIALHVAATLYHQYVRKDGLLMRMVKAE